MIILKNYATYSNFVEVEFVDEIDTSITVNISTRCADNVEVKTKDFVKTENLVLAIEKAKEILRTWGNLNE